MSEENQDDAFLTTLAALKQVIQPSDQLHKQVHVLQKENRTLFEKLEHLRQESQEHLQTVQQESQEMLQAQRDEWEAKLQAANEQARQERDELKANLETKTTRLSEIEEEKRLALERVEEERRVLEESMIELEGENKALKERFLASETLGSKLQAELNERTHAYEQSKVAMQKTKRLLAGAESNAAEINKYKQKLRDAQSSLSDLQYKLQQSEREVATATARVTSLEKESETAKQESKLTAEVAEKLTTLEQELEKEKKARASLQEQHKADTLDLRNKLSAKESLLEAKEKMIKLVTAKNESLQKKEAALKRQVKEAEAAVVESATKQAAEIASSKEEMDELKDELKCAEEEVKRCRDAKASVSKLQSKLEQSDRALATEKAKVASMQEEAKKQAAKWELKLAEQQVKAEDDKGAEAELVGVRQNLDDTEKALVRLQEQVKADTLELEKKVAAKEVLLEAKDKMLKLATAKSERLEKNEATLKQEICDARMAVASSKEKLDEIKDELKCAEEEVSRCRDSQASVLNLQSKLERSEQELTMVKAKVASMEEETKKQASMREASVLSESKTQASDEQAKLASSEQRLHEKEKEWLAVKEQLEAESLGLQSKLSSKEKLLEAKDRMLKLVTAKSEALQKAEGTLKQDVGDAQAALAEAATKHAVEIEASREALEEVRDELKCAEEEVSRCRTRLNELEPQVEIARTVTSVVDTSKSTDIIPTQPGRNDTAEDTVDGKMDSAEEQARQTEVGEASARKRKVQDDGDAANALERLDAMKAKLLAAKARQTKKHKS